MSKRSRTTPEPTPASSSGPGPGALDVLYAAPFDDFVAVRKKLAADLRAAGDLAMSREVSIAKKPSRTAWAMNQLVRKSPDVLRAAFEAFDTAARAQSSGDADAMRETARAFRERVNGVVMQCERLLVDAGAALNAAQARRLTETIRADISGGAQSRERLLSGWLTEDAEVEDPFAGLEASVGAGARQQEGGERKREHDRPGDREHEREHGREREREHERERDGNASGGGSAWSELQAQKAWEEPRERAIEQARHHVRRARSGGTRRARGCGAPPRSPPRAPRPRPNAHAATSPQSRSASPGRAPRSATCDRCGARARSRSRRTNTITTDEHDHGRKLCLDP